MAKKFYLRNDKKSLLQCQKSMGHILFDIGAIPEKYYHVYEKSVNMKPEIGQSHGQARHTLSVVWNQKGGFWYD